MVAIEKPGSPAELVLAHHGVKGQKWGVRRAHAKQVRADFRKKNPTRLERDAAIKKARFNVATGSKADRDRAIALRTTSGEKAVLSMLGVVGVLTLPVTAPISVGAGIGLGIRTARRRHIEKNA